MARLGNPWLAQVLILPWPVQVLRILEDNILLWVVLLWVVDLLFGLCVKGVLARALHPRGRTLLHHPIRQLTDDKKRKSRHLDKFCSFLSLFFHPCGLFPSCESAFEFLKLEKTQIVLSGLAPLMRLGEFLACLPCCFLLQGLHQFLPIIP